MTTNAKLFVRNLPDYAINCKYWIVSLVDNELWFYSGWDSYEESENALKDDDYANRFIVENDL